MPCRLSLLLNWLKVLSIKQFVLVLVAFNQSVQLLSYERFILISICRIIPSTIPSIDLFNFKFSIIWLKNMYSFPFAAMVPCDFVT